MKDIWLKWLVNLVVQEISKRLTPELINDLKVSLISFLRELVKNQTPGTNLDDQLVEALAKALGVP